VFHVWLADTPKEKPGLTIHDVTGEKVAEVEGRAEAGLQPIVWDVRSGRGLARPGTYSVRWPGQKDAEARIFQLLPDPAAAAAEAGVANPEKE
jgi:hypothetical protein